MKGPIVATTVAPIQHGHPHHYVSTACLHGLHGRCGVEQLARGDTTAPHCKYCSAICACPECRHAEQAGVEARFDTLPDPRLTTGGAR